MNDATNDILAALVAATPERKAAALRALRGESGTEHGTGKGRMVVEPFVCLKEVSEFLGVSRRSIWRWQVPCHRLGTRTRFRLSEVAAYMVSAAYRKRLAELKSGGTGKSQ